MGEYYYNLLPFIPIDGNTPKFFGFSEFLTGLAFMVLAWTLADVRYKFRVRNTPIPLQGITFAVVVVVGILTLFNDLWRAEQWEIPLINILSRAEWQAVLGVLFFLTFLTWAWFAFIRPPKYGRMNARRYAVNLYRAILKSSPSELSIIADEFARSAKSIIHYAPEKHEMRKSRWDNKKIKKPKEKLPNVRLYANDILLLIGDKKFCRTIIDSSPGTALTLFNKIVDAKKYGVSIEVFGKNLVEEALLNKNSFLFHETAGYESGLLGYHKPLSHAIFANYDLVESIGTLLDADIMGRNKWDATQWEAYCRVILIILKSYVDKYFWNHSFVLYRAKHYLEQAASDLYEIDGLPNIPWDHESVAKLRVIVGFVKEAVEILEEKGVPEHIQLRVDKQQHLDTFYDHLAELILEVIWCASSVRSPIMHCWWIQHNYIWGELFNFNRLNGPAAKIIKFKFRRLVYNEIISMNRFPNFKSARILGYCLNVMGFKNDLEDK